MMKTGGWFANILKKGPPNPLHTRRSQQRLGMITLYVHVYGRRRPPSDDEICNLPQSRDRLQASFHFVSLSVDKLMKWGQKAIVDCGAAVRIITIIIIIIIIIIINITIQRIYASHGLTRSSADADKPARHHVIGLYNRVGRCPAELLRIFYFQKGGRPPSWIFIFSQFL